MASDKGAVAFMALGESEGSVASIPLRYLTRHGIIAGSTGTGKSRAMQVLAEQLTSIGVNVFVSDVKGDASGFCRPAFVHGGVESEIESKWKERNRLAPFEPQSFRANYWSVSNRFIPFRFSVSSVGGILLSRLLSLNPTQESHLTIAFSYAKKTGMPLDTLEELLEVLDRLVSTNQRGISPSSVSVIQRKIIALQESGLDRMFGKPEVQLDDLAGLNVLNLSDVRQDMAVTMAPAFLLQKLFSQLPEIGDVEKPRFVVFFDEAHYLFKDANKSLKDLMTTILKQIRSKGVSVFFVTQDVADIPDEILGQLSTKIIFAQKPMTERGNARLKALAKSFPNPKTETRDQMLETIKSMPPGTAIFSTLDEDGNQTEPKPVRVFAPATAMGVVPDDALRRASDQTLILKYSKKEVPAKAKPKPIAIQAKGVWGSTPSEGMPASAQSVQSGRAKEPVREIVIEKKIVKKIGPSILDILLSGLLKLLQFALKAFGLVFDALIMKPAKALFRYLTKKPIRIIYLLILLLVLYIIVVNWTLISQLLEKLKLS